MKISITLMSILFALLSVFAIATIRGNSTNQMLGKESSSSGTKTGISPSPKKSSVSNSDSSSKEMPKDKVYHDGSSSEEIAQVTKNIEYSFASSAIKPIYINNLNKLAKLMVDEKYVVSLRGHADSVGSYKPNWMLSEKRAIKVKDYLVSKGVDQSKVITIPFGSTIPIANNKTAAGRQKNRRVEIKLKGINE